MRKFLCQSCGHEFTVPHCNGLKGYEVECPQCNERAVRTGDNAQRIIGGRNMVNKRGNNNPDQGASGNFGQGRKFGRGRGINCNFGQGQGAGRKFGRGQGMSGRCGRGRRVSG